MLQPTKTDHTATIANNVLITYVTIYLKLYREMVQLTVLEVCAIISSFAVIYICKPNQTSIFMIIHCFMQHTEKLGERLVTRLCSDLLVLFFIASPCYTPLEKFPSQMACSSSAIYHTCLSSLPVDASFQCRNEPYKLSKSILNSQVNIGCVSSCFDSSSLCDSADGEGERGYKI